ncbi:MAG: 50S ribosomal protein L29 [Dehalococcoidia bacterium]|nr:50S ribosomal protein L29 [Dehalococcoidia bacterium]
MKADEIKALSPEELSKKLTEKQKELFELRIKASTKQLKNHRQIPPVKKDIARLKTEERQRALSGK